MRIHIANASHYLVSQLKSGYYLVWLILFTMASSSGLLSKGTVHFEGEFTIVKAKQEPDRCPKTCEFKWWAPDSVHGWLIVHCGRQCIKFVGHDGPCNCPREHQAPYTQDCKTGELSKAERNWVRVVRKVGSVERVRKLFWSYGKICQRFRAFPKITDE